MTMAAFTAHRIQDWANDGALLTPPPAVSHRRATHRLETMLRKACPPEFTVLAVGLGVDCGDGRTYVPDLLVTPTTAIEGEGDTVPAADVLIAVEVMSLSNPLPGLLLRRHDYGAAGIPQLWILDARSQTLTVHTDPITGPQADGYLTTTVATATGPFATEVPFAMTIDPSQIR
ncbi:Uma2 family endonuclease [Dactylosporangium sp. NPDC005555]|uniref:Uma2 family endonuclease n=1 Tax=Dactylosporangium sp. NPDC005555 TaxID=3154889 RepID=UPI0033B5A3CA